MGLVNTEADSETMGPGWSLGCYISQGLQLVPVLSVYGQHFESKNQPGWLTGWLSN